MKRACLKLWPELGGGSGCGANSDCRVVAGVDRAIAKGLVKKLQKSLEDRWEVIREFYSVTRNQ